MSRNRYDDDDDENYGPEHLDSADPGVDEGDWDEGDPDNPEFIHFADPGGDSALRAATPDNPRDQPCPSCGEKDRLTPADVALGYQCNTCADKAEGKYMGGDY